MSDDPSAYIAATVTSVDGTEHVMISQSGDRRLMQLNMLRSMVAASFVLPTSDPHIVNALWNNAGTITISAG